ncbi:endonuclease [Bifidobacterium callitrichos]|uniref:Endonuclease NucS n=2 Tax=Bifidobacterium callitrichos TaxID=762209 RepID=A0A2T3GBF0_9BIFI|nr:endonuclease NucS [Bifidobacterium callitrichos]KAA8815531.1 endonuclease NucS [Bifidobacterium callitrichos]KFI50605.1 putative nuclease of the RecB family [Bifidobacterium callitrichos DSM 23973]PST46810.1 endonuclease [Bifidobacterium callitrichos]
MRILVADCSAIYSGRLNASLPPAKRVLLIKADNSLLIFSELGSYKPLNWMAAPCTIREIEPDEKPDETPEGTPEVTPDDSPIEKILRVSAAKSSDILEVTLYHVYSDQSFDLGQDPGLVKDGVEDHLQQYLAAQIERIGEGAKLVRREYPTAIGPVDIMAVNADGEHVAIEIKRHGGIDGVEQLTRYCELLNRDPLLAPVHGIFAAQTITPQARVLAEDRGFRCLILDYEDMKGTEDGSLRLF